MVVLVFQKILLALIQTAKLYDTDISIVETVVKYNQKRKYDMADKIIKIVNNKIKNKKISILV